MQIVCPNCGETFDLNVESDDTEFIVDCEVCCRPMTVTIRGDDIEVAPA